MGQGPPTVALVYDDDAYVETIERSRRGPPGSPLGLMGRQVAGKEFLDAYLHHGTWSELVALVRNRASRESLVRFCEVHPSSRSRVRALRVVEEARFHDSFFPAPPATLVYSPCPPDTRYAWARQHGGPGSFALSGVTHTLCSTEAIAQLCGLVTAPYERYDTLICTSRAVADMVRTVTSSYADYLRDRHGGAPGVRIRLETIPLGVDTEKFRPATPAERAGERAALGIGDDEIAVLFVGRLSHHAKAHPFPMYRAVSEAARATGRRVHLVLAGWAANPAILRAFADGARVFAPGVRTTVVDGTKPTTRLGVWRAADIFTSLPDNIQETFGLVVVEAMASGLAVVASDWDGYRDLVADGATGYLVPTTIVRHAACDATSRLVFREISYDHFLAECSQTVAVDVGEAAASFARLLEDAALRGRMGQAGRRRAVEQFAWPRIVRAYEDLWAGQEAERVADAARGTSALADAGPACYPAPDRSFAGYATRTLDARDRLRRSVGALDRLPIILATPLTSHAADRRAGDAALLRDVLSRAGAGCTLEDLDMLFRAAGVRQAVARSTVAWMLKYDLLASEPAAPE